MEEKGKKEMTNSKVDTHSQCKFPSTREDHYQVEVKRTNESSIHNAQDSHLEMYSDQIQSFIKRS